jgi:hypothetical protein
VAERLAAYFGESRSGVMVRHRDIV